MVLQDQYNVLYNQNIQLAKYKQNIKDNYSTDDQMSEYLLTRNTTFSIVNTALFYVYYALLIVVAYILFFVKKDYSIGYKVFLAILFILYPYVIFFLENVIMVLFSYLFYVVAGKPFPGNSMAQYNLLYSNYAQSYAVTNKLPYNLAYNTY